MEGFWMKYQVGKVGRVVVAKFEDKEDVLGNLSSIVKKDEIPPTPVWKNLGESHEVVGFGTIFYQGNEPKAHFHGAFGKKDMVKVGCLRENSATFLVLEAVIIELDGINAVREFDPALGLTLLKL